MIIQKNLIEMLTEQLKTGYEYKQAKLLMQVNNTTTGTAIIGYLDYIWDDKFYSIYKKYYAIKAYEREGKISSQELFKKWKSGELETKGKYNDWLVSYLQIREFINE